MQQKKLFMVLKENKEKVLLCITFSFFLFTMLFKLTHSALWGDEWIEYNYSQASIRTGELYSKVISTFQPPLYNYIMHFWLKLGSSVLWFRLFNVVIGFLSAIFLFLTVSKLTNRHIGYITCISLAVSYRWIYCIQECSEYALMLFFLFAAFYFYNECNIDFSYWKMVLFISANIGAIYSQYGSGFVSLPLLLMFYVGNIFFNKDTKRKIVVTIIYCLSFCISAIPLYVFFLQKQIENNEIANHALGLNIELCKDIVFALGKIIAYLYHIETNGAWGWIGSIFSVFLVLISVWLCVKGHLGWNKNSLIISLWLGYVLHYLLTNLHIYAMIHPNQSEGLFSRYSYFYIPMCAVILPVLFFEIYHVKFSFEHKKLILMICGASMLCQFISFYSLLGNWYKAKDNIYTEIWLEHEGWRDTTYLIGVAKYGFNYYVTHSKYYQDGYLSNATDEIDINNLPSKFWVWRTSGSDLWQKVIDKADELGYTITVYDNSGYYGQLAYCKLNND